MSPNTGRTSADIDRHPCAANDVDQLGSDGVEILSYHTRLDAEMRFRLSVKLITVITIDRPRINTVIDLEQRHPDVLFVAARECPETTVSIAILGTNAGMHHECTDAWQRENAFVQDHFAASDHDIRRAFANKRLGCG